MLPHTLPETIAYSRLLASSFAQWVGTPMLDAPAVTDEEFARALFHAPFALVSHGTQADPIFRYANQVALDLWEMDWDAFTKLPSRLSAQPLSDIQDERQQLLQKALAAGFVHDYQGIRISKHGRRFVIKDTTLWNVVDGAGVRHGQAALIRQYDYL